MLNAAAYSLGQLVAVGSLDRTRAVQALTEAAAAAGLEAPEIAATIDSGLSAGFKRPRVLPERRRAAVEAEVDL
jgi:putative DNA primase/helicase